MPTMQDKKRQMKGLVKMKNVEKQWFVGREDKEIVEFFQGVSNMAVEAMQKRQYDSAFDIYHKMESDIVEIKEYVSQRNDIRSPYYDKRRQFIRQLNDFIVDTHDKMYQIHRSFDKDFPQL